MIIAWGLFIVGILGFLGSIGDIKTMLRDYRVSSSIPISKRVYFNIMAYIEILLILCSAQYIWG